MSDDQYTNLAGAARVTGRATTTISAWAQQSAQTEPDERARRDDLFHADELLHTSNGVRGSGAWRVRLTALERVHRARGGTYWHEEAALPLASLPLATREEIARLRKRVAHLEAQLARLTSAPERLDHLTDHQEGEASAESAPAPPQPPARRATRHDTRGPRIRAHTPEERARIEAFHALPPLPDDWLAVTTWVRLRNVHGRQLEDAMRRGLLPAPQEGPWRRGSNQVKHAWTPEQVAEVDRIMRELGVLS